MISGCHTKAEMAWWEGPRCCMCHVSWEAEREGKNREGDTSVRPYLLWTASCEQALLLTAHSTMDSSVINQMASVVSYLMMQSPAQCITWALEGWKGKISVENLAGDVLLLSNQQLGRSTQQARAWHRMPPKTSLFEIKKWHSEEEWHWDRLIHLEEEFEGHSDPSDGA